MSLVITDKSQFRQKLIECQGIESFYTYFEKNSAAYSIQVSESVKLDIEVVLNDTRVIVFVFAGAKSNKKAITTPFFMARGIGLGLEASVVYISDPTFYLHDELKLAWYAGCEEFKAQLELPKVLSFICNSISAERSIFFGGSGGGFASLYYSRFMNNSMALVWNPQVNISNYPAGKYSVVNSYSKVSFGTTREHLGDHVNNDLTRFYGRGENDNIVIYMQNISDHHAKRDLRPFLNGYSQDLPNGSYSGFIDDNFYLHYTDWSEGHRPPPRGALAYLIERFSRPSLQWSKNVFPKTFMKAEKLAAKK